MSLLSARAIFNKSRSTMDCTVRNLTTAGAKLAFPNPVAIPDEFELEIPLKRLRYRVQVAWRRGTACGVKFVEK